MIHRFECRACGGRYNDTQPDGTPYEHVCGPLPQSKKKPQGERPNKRDENVAVDKRGHLQGIRSVGLGVTCLTDARLEEPPWISKLYKRIAEREEKENA
jgi:hypothetical protein